MTTAQLPIPTVQQPFKSVFTVVAHRPQNASVAIESKVLECKDYALSVATFKILKKAYKYVQVVEETNGNRRCILSYDFNNEE